MNKFGLKIFIQGGIEIIAQDIFHFEQDASEQASNYSTNGYYSRVKRIFYPAHRIECIHIIPTEENKP